jgi:hypothetical protein
MSSRTRSKACERATTPRSPAAEVLRKAEGQQRPDERGEGRRWQRRGRQRQTTCSRAGRPRLLVGGGERQKEEGPAVFELFLSPAAFAAADDPVSGRRRPGRAGEESGPSWSGRQGQAKLCGCLEGADRSTAPSAGFTAAVGQTGGRLALRATGVDLGTKSSLSHLQGREGASPVPLCFCRCRCVVRSRSSGVRLGGRPRGRGRPAEATARWASRRRQHRRCRGRPLASAD